MRLMIAIALLMFSGMAISESDEAESSKMEAEPFSREHRCITGGGNGCSLRCGDDMVSISSGAHFVRVTFHPGGQVEYRMQLPNSGRWKFETFTTVSGGSQCKLDGAYAVIP